jgi:ribulose-phosphate 3-epimerase
MPLIDDELVAVAPSILAADFAALADATAMVRESTGWLHLDVMDGHFVPNLTIGPAVVSSLRHRSDAFFDCHLMITDPDQYLDRFKAAGADLTTVHVEVGRTAEHLAEMGRLELRRGLALNPATPLETVEPFLEDIDVLLCMTVVAGFGGQAFIPEVLEKVARAQALVAARGLTVVIEVDGGVGPDNAGACAHAGARILVAGTSVFGADVPADAVSEIATAARAGIASATGEIASGQAR